MAIRVCDALCGSGKTSACIRMMNERTDRRYVFVTQFLSEVDRIVSACSVREFVTPDNSDGTKLEDLCELLSSGRNIATTHSLFSSCTEEAKQMIRDNHYCLVLDETVDIMNISNLRSCDIDILLGAGAIEQDQSGVVHWLDSDYEKSDVTGDGLFRSTVQLSKSRNLLRYNDTIYYWSIPPDLFECFEDVLVLTYMFHAQLLRCFFDIYGLPYEYVGVRKNGLLYEFCPPGMMDRRRELRDKIHVLDHKRLNSVGEGRAALSFSVYERGSKETRDDLHAVLRKNLINVFRNIYHAPGDQIMWTTFKSARDGVASKGFVSGFVPYNKRASNEYGRKKYLAYCVNNFMRPWEARYYIEHGATVYNDSYGVSFLVQWLFRSAIRNGEEVWIYVPSARMRSLLLQWLDKLAEGRDQEPVIYKGKERSR